MSMTDHKHGWFSKILCLAGLHPSCCQLREGLIIQKVTCKSCGRWDIG